MDEQNVTSGGAALLHSDHFLKRLSSKFMLASIFSMFALYAGSLINTVIIGMYLGETGLAAISLVSPVYLIYYTVGAVIGIGGSIVATRHIGKNDYVGYRQVFTCAAGLMALGCTVMTVLGYTFFTPIARMLSGGPESLDMVSDYLRFYLPGGACTLMAYIPLYFLKTDGRPKASSALFFLSAILNVVLAWVFMGPICSMGIGGASLATSVSMGVTAVVGFFILLRGSRELRFERGAFTGRNIRHTFITGTPNGLTNLLESARILLINLLLLQVGTATLLSSFTVVRNTMDLLTAIMTGVASALLPLIGVFYGERDNLNVRSVMKMAMRVGLLVIVPLMVLVSLLPGAISALFGVVDPRVLAENRLALPLTCAGLGFGYVNILYAGYFGAIKREWIANVIVALRLFVYLALFAWPLSGLLGSAGIWISFTIAEIATTVTYWIIRVCLRRRNRALDTYLLNTAAEAAADITFSVRNDIDDIMFASEQISNFCEENEISIKQSTKVGLAVEEILTVLISRCLSTDKESYVDIRVRKLEENVMMRFRYTGTIFDPVQYYETHKDKDEMMDELLGLKLIINSSLLIDFRQTFGANNLMIHF